MMTEVHDYLGAERAVTSLTRDEFFGLANDNSHLLQPATVLQQALRQKVVGLKFWREQVSGHRVTAEMTAERRETTTKRGLRSRDSNHREPTKRRQKEVVRETSERERDGDRERTTREREMATCVCSALDEQRDDREEA